MKKTDTIYRILRKKIAPFAFTREVADVFDDMAERSIPGYRETQAMIARLAVDFYQKNTGLYDLGCSTGNTILAIHRHLAIDKKRRRKPQIIAVDKSADMIAIAQKKCAAYPVEWIADSVDAVDYRNASVIIASYVLQFVPPMGRPGLIDRLYRSLNPGGIFILCEKTQSPHPVIEKNIRGLYADFKFGNGYSRIEIEQKEKALRNVLVPWTESAYYAELNRAGFSTALHLYKYYNFSGIVAIK